MLFYLITFILGFALDYAPRQKSLTKQLRKVFVVWLYVFLCFGYMTGSDWRGYEVLYESINYTQFFFNTEVGFYAVFRLFASIISDYWLAVGILKCIYLYTLLRVVKKITPYWLSVVSLLMTGSLTFVLIDNPLRFMMALIFVNIAIELILEKKYILSAVLISISVLFHNVSIFFFLIILFSIYAKKIAEINQVVLGVLYIVVAFVSSQSVLIEGVRSSFVAQYLLYNEGMKDYSSYQVEGNAAFFTIGSLLGIAFFFLVILSRDKVVGKYENGKYVYGLAIVSMFLSRLLILVPTGFRLNIPFGLFYMVYIVYLIRAKHVFMWIFIAYFCVSFPRSLWNAYVYIPYTNSIPYIINLKEHKSYTERSAYNIIAYRDRTGHDFTRE